MIYLPPGGLLKSAFVGWPSPALPPCGPTLQSQHPHFPAVTLLRSLRLSRPQFPSVNLDGVKETPSFVSSPWHPIHINIQDKVLPPPPDEGGVEFAITSPGPLGMNSPPHSVSVQRPLHSQAFLTTHLKPPQASPSSIAFRCSILLRGPTPYFTLIYLI